MQRKLEVNEKKAEDLAKWQAEINSRLESVCGDVQKKAKQYQAEKAKVEESLSLVEVNFSRPKLYYACHDVILAAWMSW
jgi:hypothetical protein